MGIFNRSIFNNQVFNTGEAVVTCEYFFTNFESGSLNDNPPDGFTKRGSGGAENLIVGDFTTNTTLPVFKRRLVTLESGENPPVLTAFSADAFDAFGNQADVDIVVAFHRSDVLIYAHDRVEVHVRGAGTANVTDGYRFSVDFENQVIIIYARYGSFDHSPFASMAISHALDEWKLYRFRISGSSPVLLRARTWAAGDTEPTTWGLSVQDNATSVPASGWVGIGGYNSHAMTSPAFTKVNFLSIASNGCSAYSPVLNVDFVKWLKRTERRCILAEMQATGYDSGSPAGAKTLNAYIANMGYTSKPSDDPPNHHYDNWIMKVPTFSREMSVALSGRATVGFGSLVVRNPASVLSGPGVRDDWLRMKWKREFIRLFIGDVSWRKSDFRPLLVGALGTPAAPSPGQIEFPITDILGLLDRDLQTSRYSGGDRIGERKPVLAGVVGLVEAVPTNAATLEFQVNDGPVGFIQQVVDNGVTLYGPNYYVRSVDSGTDLITLVRVEDYGVSPLPVVEHGFTAGFRIVFHSGYPSAAPPAPLALDTTYWVAADGLTATEFKVSASLGGGPINLTSGGSLYGLYVTPYGWNDDLANGKFTLLARPAGRVFAFSVITDGLDSTLNNPATMIEDLIFDRFGLSTDLKDSDSFTAMKAVMSSDYSYQAGMMLYDSTLGTALATLDDITKRSNTWYGPTFDGLLQIGRFALPTASPVATFTTSDVKDGSIKLERTIRPVNRATLAVRYQHSWVWNGAPNFSATSDFNFPYKTIVGEAWPGTTVPLDDNPQTADVMDLPPMDSIFYLEIDGFGNNEIRKLQTLYAKTLGVFSCQMRLSALVRDNGLPLSIGDTISLTFPRLGWKAFTAGDPQSPDNSTDFDARNAVVIGIDVDLSGGKPFPVKLTLFRQLPGYYPESDIN